MRTGETHGMQRWMHWRGWIALSGVIFAAALILGVQSGCVPMASAWANIVGGEYIEAEYKIPREPLLVLIDDRDSHVTEPRAINEANKTISAVFLAKNVNDKLVPIEELRRLMQSDKDYAKLSIRQIGEKLGAANVLYLRVDRFSLQSEPGAPIFRGEFAVRVKVISTDRKKDARAWPDSEAGKRIAVKTDPTPMDGDKSAGDVATELGIKLGKEVGLLFYGHREMEK